MQNEKIRIAVSAVLRFVRSFFAQLVVYVPAALVWLGQNPEVAKMVNEYVYWLIPSLACLSSVVLSIDKLVRDLKKLKAQ